MNVFELSASLGLDTAQFTKGLEGAGGALSSFTGGLSTVLSVIGKVDNAITSLGDAALKGTTSLVSTSLNFAKALDDNVMGVVDNLSDSVIGAFSSMATAGVNFVRDFVSEGMQFDAAMGNAGAIALKARDDFDQATVSVGNFTGNLRDYAKMLGATTKFTASQSAEALQFMFLAGYDEQTSAEMLPKVLDLAAAGAMDLGMASDMVTDAQTALGISMKDMTFFVDQMAKTASSSNTSVQQLGDALLSLGATGRMVHGGFEELNLALAVLANNGKKGSEGGNDLRRMLTRLVNPTKEAQGWFDKLGVSIYDSSTGQLKALPDLFTDLSNAMENLSEQQRNQAVSDIFGQYALAGANALLNTSTEKWTELRERIHDANGAAHEMADIQLETLSGQITLLQSALSGVKIALFDKLALPDLKDYVVSLSTGFSHLADDLENGEYDKAFTDLGETVATLITKSVTLFLTNKDEIQKVGESFITFLDKSAQSILDAGVETIPTFIRLATSLLSTSLDNVAGFISDPQNLSKIKVTINDFFNVVYDFWTNEENAKNIDTIFENLVNLWLFTFQRAFTNKRKVVYSFLNRNFVKFIDDLADNIDKYLNNDELNKTVDSVLTFIDSFANFILDKGSIILPKLVDFVLNIADKVVDNVTAFIDNSENQSKIRVTIQKILTSIDDFLDENQDEFQSIVETMFDILIGFVPQVFELRRETVVKTIASLWLKTVKESYSSLWEQIKQKHAEIFGTEESIFSWIFIQEDARKKGVEGTNIIETLAKVIDLEPLKKVFDFSWFTEGWETFANSYTKSLTEWLQKRIDQFKEVKKDLTNGLEEVKLALTDLKDKAFNWGKDLIQNFIDGISEKITALKDKIEEVANTISSFLHHSTPEKGALADDDEWMPDFMKNLAEGIEKNRGLVQAAVSNLASDMMITPEMSTVTKAGAMDVYNFEIHIGTVNGTSAEDAQNLGERLSQILYDRIYREKAAII